MHKIMTNTYNQVDGEQEVPGGVPAEGTPTEAAPAEAAPAEAAPAGDGE